MRRSHGGNSRSARKRRSRAAVLSKQMRHGDADAAFSLLQRRRALEGIAKRGWTTRLARANSARLYQHQLQEWAKEAGAARMAALEERQARERDAALERARNQALIELAICQERRTPAEPKRSRPEPDHDIAALRARFGTGGVRRDYKFRDDECRPVRPGEMCPVCGWTWGSKEPHIIAIP